MFLIDVFTLLVLIPITVVVWYWGFYSRAEPDDVRKILKTKYAGKTGSRVITPIPVAISSFFLFPEWYVPVFVYLGTLLAFTAGHWSAMGLSYSAPRYTWVKKWMTYPLLFLNGATIGIPSSAVLLYYGYWGIAVLPVLASAMKVVCYEVAWRMYPDWNVKPNAGEVGAKLHGVTAGVGISFSYFICSLL